MTILLTIEINEWLIYVLGGKVYLACRSVERARVAAEDIRKTTGASEDQLHVLQLDLGSLESVRNFAKEFKTSMFYPTVHIFSNESTLTLFTNKS